MESTLEQPTLERPREAFARLGIGATTGWKLIRQGFLETVKIGRATRIRSESVDRVIANGVQFDRGSEIYD